LAEQDPREGNNPEADERPDWLPENFKSPEDLARSYQEAQAKIREQGTQLNAMNDNFSALSQQLEELQAARTQVDPAQATTQWQELYETDPIGTQALLTQQIVQAELAKARQETQKQFQPTQEAQSQLVAAFAANEVRSRFGDWDELRDRISEEIANNPLFADDRLWADPRSATTAFEQAYTIVKGKDFLSGAIQPQQDARAMKLAAQTATGGGSRPDAPDDAQAAWERIQKAGGGSYADLMQPRS